MSLYLLSLSVGVPVLSQYCPGGVVVAHRPPPASFPRLPRCIVLLLYPPSAAALTLLLSAQSPKYPNHLRTGSSFLFPLPLSARVSSRLRCTSMLSPAPFAATANPLTNPPLKPVAQSMGSIREEGPGPKYTESKGRCGAGAEERRGAQRSAEERRALHSESQYSGARAGANALQLSKCHSFTQRGGAQFKRGHAARRESARRAREAGAANEWRNEI